MLGQRIGPYTVTRQIGGGGMGEVYEAVHTVHEGKVAIKVLLPEYSSEPEGRERFINEARAVNLIGHPGIVRVVDCGQTPEGPLFLVMEYLDGESLEQRMESSGSVLPAAVLMPIINQIAQALLAAHRRGIIHRDLKPGNVMLVPDPIGPGGERVKVLDFGIAKVPSQNGGATQTGTLMGTVAYMSPEQCRGESKIDGKADVYALGVMLYELLAGERPFHAENNLALLFKHVNTEPRSLHGKVPASSSALSVLAHAMLQKQPTRRPDMAEIAQWTQSTSNLDTAAKELGKNLAPSPVDSPPLDRQGRRALVLTSLMAMVLPILIGIWWKTRSTGPSPTGSQPITNAAAPTTEEHPHSALVDIADGGPVDLTSLGKDAAAESKTNSAREIQRTAVHATPEKSKVWTGKGGPAEKHVEPTLQKPPQKSPDDLRKILDAINSH